MNRLSLVMVLLLTSLVQGAQVIRYVDPDAAGAGDGTSWTDAYTSLSAWEAAEQVDLVLAGDYHTVNCRSSGGTADTTSCTIDGWTTGAANYIEIIQTDSPSDGIYDNTAYRIERSGVGTRAIKINDHYVRVHGVQGQTTVTGTAAAYVFDVGTIIGGPSDVRFDSCIAKCVIEEPSTTALVWAYYVTDTDWTVSYYNCIAYSNTARGTGFYCYMADTMNAYNCTAWGFASGFRWGLAGTFTATNCAVGNCTDDFVSTITVDYCISDDGDGTNVQKALGTVDAGPGATDRASTFAALYTVIQDGNPAWASGTLTDVEVWAAADITGLRIGTFFLVSGTTYECRDSVSIGNVTSGSLQTFSGLSLSVQAGDLLGAYWATGTMERDSTGAAGHSYYSGEAIDPTDQASYTAQGGDAISILAYATGSYDWTNEFTDANNGDFSLTLTGNTFANGTDDPGSGLYSDDIVGATRTSPWSIGAYEGNSSGSESNASGQIIMISKWFDQEEPLCLETLR